MQIFVSYRSLDRSIVQELVADIIDMEHDVWYDQELEGGQKWWDNIVSNIAKCDILIFALSLKSLDSFACKLEYSYAAELKKHILPVQLTDDVHHNLLPVILQERQIVNYIQRDKASYKRLAAALSQLPPTPSLPHPMPEPPPLPVSPLSHIRSEIDSSTITQEQQVAILFQLKSFLRQSDYSRDAHELLIRLSQHPMLFASVDREVQSIIQGSAQSSSELELEEPIEDEFPKAEEVPKPFRSARTNKKEELLLTMDVGLLGFWKDAKGTLEITSDRLRFRRHVDLPEQWYVDIPRNEIVGCEKKKRQLVYVCVEIKTKSDKTYAFFCLDDHESMKELDRIFAAIEEALSK